MQIDKDLVAASSTPLVLAILAEGESYGYAITDEGQAALAEQQRQWVAVARALGDAWRGPDPLPLLLGTA